MSKLDQAITKKLSEIDEEDTRQSTLKYLRHTVATKILGTGIRTISVPHPTLAKDTVTIEAGIAYDKALLVYYHAGSSWVPGSEAEIAFLQELLK